MIPPARTSPRTSKQDTRRVLPACRPCHRCYREYEAPKSLSPTAWVFEGSSWAGPYRPAPPKPPPLLTEEQAAAKASWELWELNSKTFGELPKVTRSVLFSTDIVQGVVLRHTVRFRPAWHNWPAGYTIQTLLRVDRVAQGTFRSGQELLLRSWSESSPPPPNGEQALFFIRRSECGTVFLSSISESAQDMEVINNLIARRESHPLFEWVWQDWTPRLSQLCSEKGEPSEGT